MNILFIHQNFPGQFLHAAGYLAARGHRVVCLTQHRNGVPPGVERVDYAPPQAVGPAHPYLQEVDAAVRNAQAAAEACERLDRGGFRPDIVVGHSGWGEILYIPDIWPGVKLLGYFEFYYRAAGSDVDFDPEFEIPSQIAMQLRTRNAINHLCLDAVGWGYTPTKWQHAQYPARHRERISILHEGVDTDAVCPAPDACLWLGSGHSFRPGDEVITFAARNLEPYRGFHVFMRALPEVLRRRPEAHCVIIGDDGVSYGFQPRHAPSWRQQMLAELDGTLDTRRIHFVGRLPFHQYLTSLRVSAVHVYLTYPFVLSWSLMEALSAGCFVVASRTPPVEEVITDSENGVLVDFFDTDALADRICAALRDLRRQARIRAAARETIRQGYDLRTVCLPGFTALLRTVMGQQDLPPDDRLKRADGLNGFARYSNRRVSPPSNDARTRR